MHRFAIAMIGLLAAAPAGAETVEEFYKGRQVTVIFTGATGSLYDISARMVTKHMAEHLPGKPTMVVKAMTGGGHLIGSQWLYNAAPRDGSVLASIGEAIPLTQVLEPEKVKFDVAKFNWIGNPSSSNLVLSMWHESGIKTIEDARQREAIVGAGGPTSPSGQIPQVLNNVLGTRFKVIVGFPSTQIDLAMERREVDGRGSAQWSYWKAMRPQWVQQGTLNHLVQWGLRRAPDMPNVPLLTDLARNDVERQIFALMSSTVIVGRPILTTQDVPSDRVLALREAFAKAMKDPAFLDEAAKSKIDIDPILGDELQRVIAGVVATPADIVRLTKAATSQGQTFDCKALVKNPAVCDDSPAPGAKK